MNDASKLIENLQRADAFDHPVQQFELLETHISWVLLTGPAAYKIKKPVDLGFANFSTLERRRMFCLEELRLNRRQAPDLYLSVRPILGPREAPRLGPPLPELSADASGGGDAAGAGESASGEILEYAVQMKQFAHEQLATAALARGELQPRHWDRLAEDVAQFHAAVARAQAGSRYGSPAVAGRFMRENFDHLLSASVEGTAADDSAAEEPSVDAAFTAEVQQLRAWTDARLAELADVMVRRQAAGYVRECHGDMHLGNMVFLNDTLVLFDCIDFNDELRWIDVLSEVAFTVMDLEDRAQPAAAFRFLNGYLQQTGDYADLALLPLLLVYRAMVRAKVAFIRGHQSDVDLAQHRRLDRECREYVDLAQRYATARQPKLVLMHGLSGSGKTTWSTRIVEAMGAIRVRSDVERKRMHGLWPPYAVSTSGEAATAALYGREAGQQTYQRLLQLAESIVAAGFTAIVDATFLRQHQRQPFLEMAARTGVPAIIAECVAPLEELHRRVRERAATGRDASDAGVAVVDAQQQQLEPPTGEERALAVTLGPGEEGWDDLNRRLSGEP